MAGYNFYIVCQILDAVSYIIDLIDFYFEFLFYERDFTTNGIEFVLQLFQHLCFVQIILK